jgi:ATP-dependent exoDNAse (exonuclease V) beta subunit
VLARPYHVADHEEPSVKPGFHKPESCDYKVLWFDPAVLNLDVPENFGLKQIDLLKAQGLSDQSLREYEAWRQARREVVAVASEPSVDVVRVTDIAEDPPAAPVVLDRAAGESLRSGGPRFGTLVHAIVRDAAWGADTERLQRLAEMHGRLAGATHQEQLDAAEAAGRLLAHPLLQRAAASPRCFREFPITFPISSKRVLEGVIDLVFMEDGHWHVIDFKTDEDLHTNRQSYQRQLRWYVHALSTITQIPGRGTLLQV